MTLVLDASVILIWLLNGPEKEAHTDRAIALVATVINGEHEILQPAHWLAEVAAVLARLTPATAAADAAMLQALEFPVIEEPAVVQRAIRLSIDTGQHLFDTLYHAIAIEQAGAIFITANERYRAKADAYGCMVALSQWDSRPQG